MGPRGRKHRSRRGGRKRHGSRWEEAGLPAGNQIAEESRHSGDRYRRVPEDTRCVAQLEVHCLLFMILPYLDYLNSKYVSLQHVQSLGRLSSPLSHREDSRS